MNTFSILQMNNEQSRMFRFSGTRSSHCAVKKNDGGDYVVDISLYDNVYDNKQLEEKTLHDIFYEFNMEHPADYTGRSLSVSDIVVIHANNQPIYYFCDSFGWVEVLPLN